MQIALGVEKRHGKCKQSQEEDGGDDGGDDGALVAQEVGVDEELALDGWPDERSARSVASYVNSVPSHILKRWLTSTWLYRFSDLREAGHAVAPRFQVFRLANSRWEALAGMGF